MTIRRFITMLALTGAALAFTGGSAMATKGSCDPGVGQSNSETLSLGGGQVLIQTVYGWDGVSVFPECVGAVQSVRVRNVSQSDWWVTIPRNRRGSISLRAVPGTDKTYTGSQLALVGIQTNEDLAGLNWFNTRPAGTVADLP